MTKIIIGKKIFKGNSLRGAKIGGKYPLLLADTKVRRKIFDNIKADWKDLIRLSFQAEGGINTKNGIAYWKELSDEYADEKIARGWASGILEASTPSLMSRYLKSISYSAKNLRINIEFPKLIAGKRDGYQINAGVHQFGREDNGLFTYGMPKRPLIKKTFIEIAKKRVREPFEK